MSIDIPRPGLVLAKLLVVSDNKKDFVSEKRLKEEILEKTGTEIERSVVNDVLKEMGQFANMPANKQPSWTQRGKPGNRIGGWRFVRERIPEEVVVPLQLPDRVLYTPAQAAHMEMHRLKLEHLSRALSEKLISPEQYLWAVNTNSGGAIE
jgi:hypothetical protein